jgi:uncharacterized membrane protein
MTADSGSDDPHPLPAGNRVGGVPERLRSPDRVVVLTDGVFAIIMTILVLELTVPPNLSHESLRALFEELRPTLVAWIISFVITGMYWVSHRDLFAAVRYVNRELVWLNLIFVLFASLIPFAASVLGSYPDEPFSVHIYGAVMIMVSVTRLVLYRYTARRPSLRWPGEIGESSGVGYVIVAAPIIIYVIAMALADVSTWLSEVLFFLVPAVYFVLVSVLRHQRGTAAKADYFS